MNILWQDRDGINDMHPKGMNHDPFNSLDVPTPKGVMCSIMYIPINNLFAQCVQLLVLL